jgi:hypothetical protein
MRSSRSFFWGIILIVFGIVYFLDNTLGIHIDLGSVLLPLILIFLGISVMLKPERRTTDHSVVFDEATMKASTDQQKYDTVFGKGVFDFRDFPLGKTSAFSEINVVFGSGQLYLKKDLPVRLRVSTAFASARLPNGNSAAFGETTYTTPAFNADKPFLDIKANVVFSGLDIYQD